jgi:hypothetical protein
LSHEGEKRMMQGSSEDHLRESFPSVLSRSIREGIASVVGRQTALSVEFYLDTSLAVKDILAYTKALERFFTVGSKLIEERCARALYHNLGFEFNARDGYRLCDYVEEAKKIRLSPAPAPDGLVRSP